MPVPGAELIKGFKSGNPLIRRMSYLMFYLILLSVLLYSVVLALDGFTSGSITVLLVGIGGFLFCAYIMYTKLRNAKK